MSEKEKVLEAIKKLNKPTNAIEIAKETGLDKKIVEKAMNELKKEEKIFSPKRCYWQAK